MNMTMQKFKSLTLGALMVGLALSPAQSSNATETEAKEVNYRPFSIGVGASTLGLGGSASWRFSNHLGLRAGVNYFRLDMSNFEYESQGASTTVINSEEYDTTFRLLSESLAVDIYPWADKSFRISIGALLNQNKFTGHTTARNDGSFYEINGNLYLQSAVGDLHFKAEQEAVCPFVTVGGSLYLGKSKQWSLEGEVGVAYTGSPDVTLTPANSGVVTPSDLEAESRKIEDDAKDFKFYPIVRVGLSFSF